MFNKCVVCDSRREKQSTLSFHRFPKAKEFRTKWALACGLQEALIEADTLICSKHFTLDDYDDSFWPRRRLLPIAVPAPSAIYQSTATSSSSSMSVDSGMLAKPSLQSIQSELKSPVLDISTLKANKQQHQTPINTLEDQKPVTSNFVQRIKIQPFAKMIFGSPDAEQASTLLEPEIEIIEKDPLLITYTNKNKNKSPPQPKNKAAIQEGPRKAIIKEIRMVTPRQAETLDKFKLSVQTTKVASPTTTKSATPTIFKVATSTTKPATPTIVKVANSTTTKVTSIRMTKFGTPLTKVATPINKAPTLLTSKLPPKPASNVQVSNKINAAPPAINKVATSTARPIIKLLNTQVAAPKPKNLQVATKDKPKLVISTPQSMYKFKIQSNPVLKLVATSKPNMQVSNKINAAIPPKTVPAKLNLGVAASKPVTNVQNSNKAKAEMVDLTLDDDESTTDNPNRKTDDSASKRQQNDIIVIQETDERYKTDLICKICSLNKPIPYFRVPASMKALSIWKFCLKDNSVNYSDVVCASHFTKEDFLEVPPDGNSLGKLKPHVVPSPTGNIRHGCVIPTCINKYRNSPNMYPVPVWADYKPWTKLIQYITYTESSELLQYRFCDRHFDTVTEQNMFCLKPNQIISIDHELDEYMKKRSKLGVVLGNQLGGICTFLTCRRELYGESYKFPEDYEEAHYWLTLCKRNDILLRNTREIKEYLNMSQGLCLEHYNQVKSNASVIFKHNSQKEGFSDNETSYAQENVTYKEGDMVPHEITYVPMKHYCAFRNCSSHLKIAKKKVRFPSKPELSRKWQEACGIAGFINMNDFPGLFVCGKHFKKDQYSERGTLKKDSVPESYVNYIDPLANSSNMHWVRKSSFTKRIYVPKPKTIQSTMKRDYLNFSQPSTSTGFNNDGPSAEKRLKVETTNFLQALLLNKKCCVKHCKSDGKPVLFGFSNLSRHVRELWIKGVENSAHTPIELCNQYLDKSICSNHFEQQYRINDTELTNNAIPTLGLIDDSIPKIDPDTSVEWIKPEIDSETDQRLLNNPVRSKVILRENSIEFASMKRALKFGEAMEDIIENKIPSDVLEEAAAATNNLYPEKTKQRYQQEYDNFKKWRQNKNIHRISEEVLLAYAKGMSETYSSKTLWTKISMLKLALRIYENIDISRFGKLFMFLRRKNDGYSPKKAKVLSESDIIKFLLEADDNTWLLEKVVLVLGILGACRRSELLSLTIDNFEDTEKTVLVSLKNTENKKDGHFLIPKTDLPFDAYGLYKKYTHLRPPNFNNRRFFVGYKNGKCVKQVVGIHTIGSVPKKIATFLNLENPKLYTGHSFLRTSATMLVENSGDLLSLKELGGWESSTVAETYIEKSVSKRMKITKQLFQNNSDNVASSNCPKMGINKFPYNVYRMHNQEFKLQQENIRIGSALQMHSAIVIDDDDEIEKNALDMICKVLWENQPPQRRRSAAKNINH